MDYEKKYKEALERAKNLHKDAIDMGENIRAKQCEIIFPELKENEDEKIRKSLIDLIYKVYAHTSYITCVEHEDMLAWLEKQGETYTKKDIDDAYLKGISDAKDELEKQGEQKSDDKVEPKFKVGDWIVYNRDDYSREIIQVYDIRDGRYYFTDNVHFSWSVKECDEQCRLWTIQDAKDGDVLQLGEVTAIFKEYIGNERCICYCSFYKDGGFEIPMENGEDNVYGCYDDTIPATKEQRDLLFQKMNESGYEWDAEKKEPKKIHVIDEGKAEMDYCFTKMMNGEKVNPAWSKEDEERIREIIEYLNELYDKYRFDLNELNDKENWLKSLKDRIKGE